MSNKKYRCPYCEQTSSRMWNLRVHLRRRHEATGEQVGPAFDHEPIYGFKPREKLSGRLSKNDFNYSYRSDVRGGANINSKRNSLDDTIDYLRRAVEIKRLTKELNPQYQQLQLFMPSMDHNSINYTDEFIEKIGSLTFTPETDPLRDWIIGLRCHIWETCLSTVALPIHGFKESCKIVPSHHQCNSKRVANLRGLTGPDRRSKIMELYQSLPEIMKEAAQDWWLDGVSPHLIVVPLTSPGNDTYEFTPQVLKDHRWLSIAIENTMGNTFIKFSIWEANTTLHGPSYFMTLSKGPFLPFKFTIDNHQPQL